MDNEIEKIKSRFFWTNLSTEVKKFVKEWFDCQKVKPPKTYCKPKLMPLGPTRTLMIVTMDMAGLLPETPRAKEVAEKCLEYFMIFVIPEAVHTDQGTKFTSKVIESL